MSAYEAVHPLEGGAFRLKFRRDRRNGLPRENPFLFYARYFGESVVKMWRYWSVYRQCKSILDEVLAAPDRWTYTDLAIAPPRDDEFEALDLYHATAGGEAALARKQRDDAIRNNSMNSSPDGLSVRPLTMMMPAAKRAASNHRH